MHALLQRNYIFYSKRTVRNHLKALGAKIKHVRFKFIFNPDKNPLQSIITYTIPPPKFIPPNKHYLTHPQHEKDYYLWLLGRDNDRVLILSGVRVRRHPMKQKWARRHTSWNCLYKLKQDDSYLFIPVYFDRPVKMVYGAWSDDQRLVVSRMQLPTYNVVCEST